MSGNPAHFFMRRSLHCQRKKILYTVNRVARYEELAASDTSPDPGKCWRIFPLDFFLLSFPLKIPKNPYPHFSSAFQGRKRTMYCKPITRFLTIKKRLISRRQVRTLRAAFCQAFARLFFPQHRCRTSKPAHEYFIN